MPELFTSITEGRVITLSLYLICTLTALFCGALIVLAASFRSNASKSLSLSLLLLPAIVETVIIMVNGNVGTGIAVAGAFSLVRFRSAPGKARDIAAIFLAMTAGLTCAAGYVAIALLFTVLISAILAVATLIPTKADKEYELRVTVPESLSYADAFDDIFKKYSKSARLTRVKTSNMGSLYKLYYKLQINDNSKIKEMIDELRCRNGNLEISLTIDTERSEEL